MVRYSGRRAEASMAFLHTDNSNRLQARLAGAFTWMAGGLHVSRPIRQGFALVRVGSQPGVEVRFRNRRYGKTGNDGSLFLPGLTPYSANRLSLGTRDLPLEVQVDTTPRFVSTPFLGGGVIDFEVQRMQAIVGRVFLIDDTGERRPAEFATLQVEPADGQALIDTIIGRGGQIYLEMCPLRAAFAKRARLCESILIC